MWNRLRIPIIGNLTHCCRWSPYASDNNGDCGAETDDQYWYMGNTECFRANAAFSLYGVLNGKDDIGCARKTFINSFFTTSGVETFAQALYSSGVTFQSNGDADNDNPGGVTSQCSYDDSNNNADDSVSHNQKYGSGYASYGLGCYKNSFAMKQFKGPFCNSRDEVKITDKMTNFNNDLQQATCVPIYSADGSGNNGLDLLSYITACSVREFPSSCPDPHGILARYARADAKAVARAANPTRERLKSVFSWILLCLGAILIIFSANVCIRRRRRSRRKSVLEDGMKRKWFARPASSSRQKGVEDSQTSNTVPGSTSSRSVFGSRRLFRFFGR